MTDTDKIRAAFEFDHKSRSVDLEKDSDGHYLDTFTIGLYGTFERAYKQGQRDLVEAMGETVAWARRHPDGGLTDRFIANDDIEPVRKQSGAWVPLYKLPEGMQK